VLGVVRPAITFELRMPPPDAWNGKFYMAGCGGFCGRLDSDLPGFTNAMNHGLRRGYAAATTTAALGNPSADGRWAWNNRLAENDMGLARGHRNRACREAARVGDTTASRNGTRISPAARPVDAWRSWKRSAFLRISTASSPVPRRSITRGLVGTHAAWVNTGEHARRRHRDPVT
jgi:hypothetical protein